MNNSSIDQVFFIDLFLFFLNKRMQVGITWQGPLKWPLIINDLNSLCLSSTKATIVHCILELGSTIYLDSFGIFGGRVIIYVEVDYGNLVFFLCKFWKPLPPYYLVFFFPGLSHSISQNCRQNTWPPLSPPPQPTPWWLKQGISVLKFNHNCLISRH